MKVKGLIILSSLLIVGCNSQSGKQPTLSILSGPEKTVYNCGEDFDKTGLVLLYTDENGNKTEVTDYVLEEDKNLSYDDDKVYAIYNDKRVKINITVNPEFNGNVTCVGDSLTAGHSWPNEAYPVYVPDYMADVGAVSVKNCGINGASFKTFGQYNPAYNTTQQYKDSLTGDPQVITILLGTNDATNWANEQQDYVNDYTALVNEYRTTFGDDIEIIMITSPRCTTNSFGIPGDTIVNEVNPLQRQLAEDLDCNLIDFSETCTSYTDSELFRDGVHLTQKAAKILAEEIANKIKEIYDLD